MRRGLSLFEAVCALTLALTILSAFLPARSPELDEVRARLEQEAARLIVEGELARARLLGLEGRLAAGEARLRTAAWPSADRLEGLVLSRRVGAPDAARAGLLPVTVVAEWRGRRFELTGLVAPGGPR